MERCVKPIALIPSLYSVSFNLSHRLKQNLLNVDLQRLVMVYKKFLTQKNQLVEVETTGRNTVVVKNGYSEECLVKKLGIS